MSDGEKVKGATRSTRRKKGEVIDEKHETPDVSMADVPDDVAAAMKDHAAALKLGRVGARLTYKMNLGNYESMECMAEVHFPCTPKSLDRTYEVARKWCIAKVEEAMKDASELKN